MRQVLYVRLACGVAKDRSPAGGDRRGQGILRRRHAGLVKENVRAAQLRRAQAERILELERNAQTFEREEVRVEPSAADDVTAGRRQLDLTAARQQRRGQQNRRADLPTQLGVELRGLHRLGVYLQRIPLGPLDVRAD